MAFRQTDAGGCRATSALRYGLPVLLGATLLAVPTPAGAGDEAPPVHVFPDESAVCAHPQVESSRARNSPTSISVEDPVWQ